MNATAETGGGAPNTTSPDSNPSTPSLAAAALAFGGKLILIDENMNASGLADELRQLGYNIITMKEAGLPVGTGYPDPKIIEWAKQNQAYILTQNVKDFKKAYDLVIGSKNGWTVQEITARMSALQRQYSAAPDSLKWLTYVSLMEDGFLRRILSIPLFAPFDPSTGCMFGPAPVDGVQLVPGCGPKMDN